MRVAMITEGTYPFVHGGVSTWCDRLIRELPDIEFDIYAISPGTGYEATWELPDNVTSLIPIELSIARNRSFDWYLPRTRTAFLEAFDALVTSVLNGPDPEHAEFLDALRALHEIGEEMPLDVGIHSESALEILLDRWTSRRVGDRLDQMGRPSLHDVLDVTSALGRYLMPLVTVPEADVSHTTANGLSSLPAFTAKWRHGTPILLTEHGIYLRERFIEAYKSDAQDRVKAFNLLFFRNVNDATIHESDLISPVSDYNARWERETGADDDQIVTIYNGVDPASFEEITTEPEVPTVSWIGRVDPLKDVETLIRSFAVVRDEVPDAQLRLFGPIPVGNEEYHEGLLAAIDELSLHDQVTFEGLIRPPTGAYVAGHVVALSSISEGFPFTVIEAMMSGRATVSTDVGGVAEAVGDAGLLVPPRDPDALGRALVKLLEDDELRRDMGKAARERALEHLTLDLMADRYRDLYTRLALPADDSVGEGMRFMEPRTTGDS